MAVVTTAPDTTLVRHAELVGIWAVACPCARRADGEWAIELLGDDAHLHATLQTHDYALDSFEIEPVGTIYVRLVCGVSVLPGVRTVRGAVDDLLLAAARSRRTPARLIDAAVV